MKLKMALKISAAAAAVLWVVTAGCGKKPEQAAATTPAAAGPVEKEAAALAALVKAGQLPALEERLPDPADVMVETMDSVGVYSDHLTLSGSGRGGQWGYGMFAEEPLFRFKMDGTIEPNVAKSFTVNADSTEYTIYLRKGMKWSDGMPFTSEDCIFFFEHMMSKRTYGNAIYQAYYSSDPETGEQTLCTMEKVNDYEFKVKFKDPSPTFLEQVAIDTKWMFAPAHYYKTLLPEFIGDEAAAAKAKEMGFADVAALGRQTGYYYWNIVGRPTLRPWNVTNDPDSELMIMERNPYFWKVDAEGKQLPYFNQIHWVKTSDDNQPLLMLMSGELDYIGVSFNQVPVLQQNQAKGDYHLVQWESTGWSGAGNIQFNQSSQNPKLRALFASIDFRHALSIAADREEMSAIVSDGWSTPAQTAPAPGASGYSETWFNKWTEYDPAEARRLLNATGLLKEGADGFFTFADGTPLVLEIYTEDSSVEGSRAGELLTEKYFKEIGIKATITVRDRGYIDQLRQANQLDIAFDSSYALSTVNVALRADNLVPIRNNFCVWYGAFGTWFATGGKEGEEPTGEIAALIDTYRKMRASSNREDVQRYAQEIYNFHERNIWQIGYLTATPALMAIKNNLKNFPEHGIICDEFRNIGIGHPLTWYLEP